ncbi:MAG: Uma2 family endonuclease [Planctomycetota bacterium]|nr:Uma2 family endonuclease [Planctomycetota bacterium]
MSGSITTTDPVASHTQSLPPLRAGERLDQPTFHARYEAMPPETRAELIEGVVYIMPAALKRPHSRHHARLIHWVLSYEDATPGVEGHDNATAILSNTSEPQPDAFLMISPELGGTASVDERDYIVGTPEFVAEVSDSSEAIDLGAKKRDYERVGVREYVVIAINQRKVYWFVNRNGRFEQIEPDDGIHKSEVFPGLWLDPQAWLDLDGNRMREVLEIGLATTEHAEYVKRIQRDDA